MSQFSNFLSKLNIDQGGVDVAMKKKTVHISGKEVSFYNKLFDLVDYDEDDKIDGKEGAQFLRRSGLDNDVLGEIWKLAGNGKNKPTLSRNGWMVACKLVACAQEEGEPSIKAIADTDFELADFNLGTDSTYSEDLTLPNGDKTFEIVVAKPHTVGTVLNKHTEYAITVKTSMENYPESELTVNRRYSDFEWLFNRLTRTFPGRVIPPIPEKQTRNRFDKDFVEGRRLGLQKFLDEVTRDPMFAVTYDVQVFLTASSEGMNAARSVLPAGDGALTDMMNKAVAATRTGMSKVIETTTGNALETVDQNAEFGDVEYNLVKYSEQMRKVIVAEEKMVQTQATSAKALMDAAGYFTNFVMVARTFEDVDALDYFTKVSDNLKEVGNFKKLDSNATNEGLITDLRGFSGKAMSVCQVIHNRERCVKDVEKQEAAVEKAKEEPFRLGNDTLSVEIRKSGNQRPRHGGKRD